MKKNTTIFLSVLTGAVVVTLGVLFLVRSFAHEFTLGLPGDTTNVQITEVPSEHYTQQDIDSAIQATKQYFQEHFNDCILTEISYAGEEWYQIYQSHAQEYDADEVMVLTSSFQTGSHPDISLNKNSPYTQWKWILVRKYDSQWKHVDHGY